VPEKQIETVEVAFAAAAIAADNMVRLSQRFVRRMKALGLVFQAAADIGAQVRTPPNGMPVPDLKADYDEIEKLPPPPGADDDHSALGYGIGVSGNGSSPLLDP